LQFHFSFGVAFNAILDLTNTASQSKPLRSKKGKKKKIMNQIITENPITLTGENLIEFIKAMKIGYYKIFRKNGLITDRQFEILMQMQAECA